MVLTKRWAHSVMDSLSRWWTRNGIKNFFHVFLCGLYLSLNILLSNEGWLTCSEPLAFPNPNGGTSCNYVFMFVSIWEWIDVDRLILLVLWLRPGSQKPVAADQVTHFGSTTTSGLVQEHWAEPAGYGWGWPWDAAKYYEFFRSKGLQTAVIQWLGIYRCLLKVKLGQSYIFHRFLWRIQGAMI